MEKKEKKYKDCIGAQDECHSTDTDMAKSDHIPNIPCRLENETSKGSKKKSSRFAEICKMIMYKFFSAFRRYLKKFNEKKKLRSILSNIFTIVVIPLIMGIILNMCNNRDSENRMLRTALENIVTNYSAGNYSEVEQGIISVYPILQKRMDRTTSLALVDILLEIKYQEFWESKTPLSDMQMALIKQYSNDALEYAKKLDDLASYIKICIYQANFYMAEYEFTLKTEYLNELENVLYAAGDFFDIHHIDKLKIDNMEDAQLVCQFFNLKNMQYQTRLYQHLNVYTGHGLNESEIIQLSEIIDDLLSSSTLFTSCTEIIADLNEEYHLIPDEIICHMRIRGILAYLETGNKISDFEKMPLMLISGGKYTEGTMLVYDSFESCCNLFQSLEKDAISIHDYDDLIDIYETEEEYFYRCYVLNDSEEALRMYQAVIEKMMNLDKSGCLINPCTISTGNGFVLDHYISTAEERLNEMNIADDAFGFCLLHYKLGTHYMSRAMYAYENGILENCKSDFIEADRHYETSLLYFSEDTKGIYEAITSDRDLIQNYLSSLAMHKAP